MLKEKLLAATPRTPMLVPLVDLINTLDGSADACGWEGEWWFDEIAKDKASDDNMGDLLDSILEEGLFIPLNVIRYDDVIQMGNGHHRLILAALCGIETVGVYVSRYGVDWTLSESKDWDEDDERGKMWEQNPNNIDIYSAISDWYWGE